MAVHVSLYVGLVVASAALATVVSTISWRNRDIAGAAPLGVLMLAAAVWASAKLLELVSPGLSSTLFWSNMQYFGIVVVPVAWLVFVLEYTGQDRWLTRNVITALSIEPVFVLGMLWTNGAHQLFRTSVELVSVGSFTGLTSSLGPVFWIHAGYSYLLLAIGTGLIIQMIVLSDHLYRGQAFGLLTAVMAPWVGNGLFLAGIAPPSLDPTIIAFTLTGLVLLVVIARHRLLDIVPVAREMARNALIESMTDAVVVVDERNRLMDTNPAANTVLDCEIPGAIGRPLEEVYPPLAEAVDSMATDGSGDFWTELEVRDADGVRYYDVRVSSLQRGLGILTGRLISLRDVTDRRQREQRLDVLNRLLRHNLRNELNVIGGNASLLREAVKDEEHLQRIETIETAVDTLMERSEKVAQLANRPDLASRQPINIVEEIDNLVATKRRAHPEVTITVEGPDEAWVETGPAVITAIEELLTNSIKHTDTETPTIALSIDSLQQDDGDTVRISVADNGPGIPQYELDPIIRGRETPLEHGSGLGLWLVTWVVRESGGDVEFTEHEGGAKVTVSLPVAP